MHCEFLSQDELKHILQHEKMDELLQYYSLMKEVEGEYNFVEISSVSVAYLSLANKDALSLLNFEPECPTAQKIYGAKDQEEIADVVRLLLATKAVSDQKVLKISMKDIEELYSDLEMQKRKLLEEKTLTFVDLENSDFYGLSDKFLEAMRRKNEMRSWSTSRASSKSKKAEPLDKRAVYVDLDEKNLFKLLFLGLKRGPTGLKDFLERNKEITSNFTEKQFRRLSEFFNLDDEEIETLSRCFSPMMRSQE